MGEAGVGDGGGGGSPPCIPDLPCQTTVGSSALVWDSALEHLGLEALCPTFGLFMLRKTG